MNQKQFAGMDLASRLASLLDQVDGSVLTSTSREMVKLDFDGGSFSCELQAVDKLACVAHEIMISSERTKDWTSDKLTAASDDLSSRLNYLLEPISTIEFDREAEVLQMRSNPPGSDTSTGENCRSYYEVLARPGSITMARYLKKSGEPRQRAPMTLTREVLGRIASDMLATVVA